MLQYANQLYEQMQEEIREVKRDSSTYMEEIEACFQVALKYWKELRKELICYEFKSTSDEIYFFKCIKPKFTSEIEFYNLVYSAELFKPIELAEEEVEKFWNKESYRLKRFISDNLGFVVYYKDCKKNRDEQFFLREHLDVSNLPEVRLFEIGNGDSTNCDHVVSRLLALEKYSEYINTKIGK
jgi:hypothetical protein